jgi:hypothetical protein
MALTASGADAQPPHAAAQRAAQVSTDEIAHLDRAMQQLVDLQQNGALRGTVGVLFGGTFIAVGAYTMFGDDSLGHGAGRAIAAAVLIGLGGVYTANGVRAFDSASTDQRRLERFHAAEAKGAIDDLTFARFEGGLFAEAEVARQLRLQSGVGYIGMTAAGAGVLALSLAAPDYNDDARLWGSVVGGFYLAYGLWQSIALLSSESAVEHIVREYAHPAPHAKSALALHVSPLLAPRAYGLQLRATI